ncbi:MAG: hypothetical protein OSB32_05380 [Candidatus Poseidoniales archaeon]|nr:hypothetical protein [Candidatus Poseidoniales archaeon]
MTATRARMAWAILALLLLSSCTTTVSADPDDHEVVNTICQTWNSTSGICDDYNYADDETASMEWIEGRYNVNMANATMMSVTLEWAIHEVRRDDVMLGDLPLGNGSDASMDGIPADYLRNYIDYVTLSGSTVREMLRSSVSSTVASVIDNGFGTTSGVQTSYVNQITYEDQTIQCTDNPDVDSADEVAGLPNDAYNPPLCLRTTLDISIDPAELGMTAIGLDVERTYQGLLTMGGIVRTNINLTALPGHAASYEFVPPSYGTAINLSGGGDLVPANWGGFDYSYGRWNIDHKDATDDTWLNQSASITMARRSTTTSPVEIDIGNDRGIRVDIIVDASNERATSVEVRLGIHHVGMDTLSNWDWDFADDRVSVPWVTADGLRMAHHTGLANLSDFADKVPVEDLNELIAEHSPTEIEFETFAFSPPDGIGGLDFVHRPGVTCSESTPSNWCILGQTAMNGTYPVYLTSRSNTFDMDVGAMVTSIADQFDIDLLGFDPSMPTKEDRAAILNGIILSGEVDSSSLISWMDDDLPQADIRLEIMLPDYIRSTNGNPESIVITHTLGEPETHSLSVTGAQPYDWRHPICRESNCGETSLDLICGANRRTCLGLNLDVEFSDLDVQEWSRSIEMVAEGEMEFLLYRIGVPDSVLEDVPNLDIEAVPSDFIRRFVHLGNQMDGGLLAPLEDSLTVPFEGEDIPFVLTENGLNNFAREVASIVETQVNEDIQVAIDDINQEGEVFLKNPGHVSISVSIDGLDRPAVALSDLRPIRVLIEVSKTTIHAEYVGESGSGEELASKSMNLWTNSLLAANGGGGVELPPDDDIVIDVPSIAFEIEGEVVSPSVRLRVTLPWGIGFSNFKSDMGRGEITENDGSEVLTYYVPLCMEDTVEACEDQSDTLSFRVTIGIDYILSQLLGYIAVIVGLLVLLLMWRRGRKRRKRERKAQEESDIVGHRMSDLHVLSDDSYGEDGLPDMGNLAGLDDKGDIPKESWEDDFGF